MLRTENGGGQTTHAKRATIILEASAKSTFEASSTMEPRSSGWRLRSWVGTQPEGMCGGHHNKEGVRDVEVRSVDWRTTFMDGEDRGFSKFG
ncbi:hypothetical protein Pyn_10434 [Prunus yedoensis var. nudiflora]|uniref:Uncharacterized protein n=1 Tax=Prunus yedoensis var. nudiflora TaxID=2094558 RepID=A0A314XSY9_PRUYE|nr:hypothetical protein Pyn_10434 [Prunus yedoensis var. nudiflora]